MLDLLEQVINTLLMTLSKRAWESKGDEMKTLRSNWIARCASKACKATHRVDAGTTVAMWNGKPALRCACGSSMIAKLITGTVTDHECDDRCLAATGPACECSCGGANHGANHV